MNIFKRVYCRTFQLATYMASPFLPWREPELIADEDSMRDLAKLMKERNWVKPLIISGHNTPKLGLMDGLIEALKECDIDYSLFSETIPNPTIECAEQALKAYLENNCNCIIAFGGGSPMDCAKAVAGRVARPNKSLEKMKGLLKILKKTPPLIAIPTTAGSGSECTLAAVISDGKGGKYAINDPVLIPQVAVLSPNLTITLPPFTTAITGMDALTHAVEAYIGKSNTRKTSTNAKQAVKLIFENLDTAVSDGQNIESRKNMQIASYKAGIAFTRAYVGYVHAMAHQLGGLYETPHGLACAILLPHVLKAYGNKAYKKLSYLANEVGITGNSAKEKAEKFISEIESMLERYELPTKLDYIQTADIPRMVKSADSEANPLYPVPKLMDKKSLAEIYKAIQK